MTKDYSKGRYKVLEGRGPAAPLIGWIDGDEFVRDHQGRPIYRIDGDEFYGVDGRFIGTIEELDNSCGVISREGSGTTCHFLIVKE